MTNQEIVKKYQQSRDAFMPRPTKGEGEAIREAAKSAGKIVQAYILSAVRERMSKSKKP